MPNVRPPEAAIGRLRREHGDVLRRAHAQALFGNGKVRWQLRTGAWQAPRRGVVVLHSGPLTPKQRHRSDLLAAGRGAVLAGLTAAALDGLKGFDDSRTFVLVPAGCKVVPPPGVVAHASTLLGEEDVHPSRSPLRTRLPRSLIDAATWSRNPDSARGLLAASVQQGLVRASDLALVLVKRRNTPRRRLLVETVGDIVDGAHALSELDFTRLLRQAGLPEPERQVVRRDRHGRVRYLDVYYSRFRLVIEIDGAWHMEVLSWWADMFRDNELTVDGNRVLRFPAFVVRERPDLVIQQIERALRSLGWTGQPAA